MKMDITNGLNNCKVYAYLHGRKKTCIYKQYGKL